MEPLRILTMFHGFSAWHLSMLPMLLALSLPLTLLWCHALYDCLRGGAQHSPAQLALDTATWTLLLVFSGWFGGLAYLGAVTLPRIVSALRAQGGLSRSFRRRLMLLSPQA